MSIISPQQLDSLFESLLQSHTEESALVLLAWCSSPPTQPALALFPDRLPQTFWHALAVADSPTENCPPISVKDLLCSQCGHFTSLASACPHLWAERLRRLAHE